MNESVFFYTCNDYLVINSLLYGNHEGVLRGIEIAHKDAQGVMNEAIEQGFDKRWGVSIEDGEKIFTMYKNRFPEVLDDNTIEQAIKRAKDDIKNIFNTMKPSTDTLKLYRNVRLGDALKEYNIGNVIELKGFNSTSLNPNNESYEGKSKPFVRYEITIPKGTPIIRADLFKHEMNEHDEVILPPLKARVKNTNPSETEKCENIIVLEFLELLDVKGYV